MGTRNYEFQMVDCLKAKPEVETKKAGKAKLETCLQYSVYACYACLNRHVLSKDALLFKDSL